MTLNESCTIYLGSVSCSFNITLFSLAAKWTMQILQGWKDVFEFLAGNMKKCFFSKVFFAENVDGSGKKYSVRFHRVSKSCL